MVAGWRGILCAPSDVRAAVKTIRTTFLAILLILPLAASPLPLASADHCLDTPRVISVAPAMVTTSSNPLIEARFAVCSWMVLPLVRILVDGVPSLDVQYDYFCMTGDCRVYGHPTQTLSPGTHTVVVTLASSPDLTLEHPRAASAQAVWTFEVVGPAQPTIVGMKPLSNGTCLYWVDTNEDGEPGTNFFSLDYHTVTAPCPKLGVTYVDGEHVVYDDKNRDHTVDGDGQTGSADTYDEDLLIMPITLP